MKALVVDDSRTVRMMLTRMLGTLSFEVTEFGEGASALAWLEGGGEVDVVLVDWNMPIMDGITFTRKMREQPRFAATGILMVSSETNLAKMAEAVIAGVDEYLMKPVDVESLRSKLQILGFQPSA